MVIKYKIIYLLKYSKIGRVFLLKDTLMIVTGVTEHVGEE